MSYLSPVGLISHENFFCLQQKGEKACCFLLRSCQSVDFDLKSLVPFSLLMFFAAWFIFCCKLVNAKKLQFFSCVLFVKQSFTKTPCMMCTFLLLLSFDCTQWSREDGNNISQTMLKVHTGTVRDLQENLRGQSRRSDCETGFTR